MKFNHAIIYIIIIIIQICNGALSPEENSEAISIIKQITGETVTDPCCKVKSYELTIFKCKEKIEGLNQHYVSKFEYHEFPKKEITVTSTFGVFKQITSISFYNRKMSLPNIYNEIHQLTNLTSLIINNQNSPIPSTVILPSSLKIIRYHSISVKLPESIFNSSLSYLNIYKSSGDFSIPSILPLNNQLQNIYIPITSKYNQLPSNFASSLIGLKTMILTVSNDRNQEGYRDYEFPTLSPILKLKKLVINFYDHSNNIQKWQFPKSISTLSTLNTLTINGDGFEIPSSNIFDFHQLSKGLALVIISSSTLEKCTSTCFKLPKNSNVRISMSKFNLDYFNFTNVARFSFGQSGLNQPLPVHSNIDYKNIKSFHLSNFNGAIPEEYCNFNLKVLSIIDSNITSIPSCYTCIGEFYGSKDNISSSIECPTYSFSKYNGIAKTNKNTLITIYGKDFGWSFTQLSPKSSLKSNPSLSILHPNAAVVLTIPKGDGKNKNLTASFGHDNRYIQVFKYSYESPKILDYEWIPIDKYSSKFLIYGTGFSFVNSNIIELNDTEYITGMAIDASSSTESILSPSEDSSLGQISFVSNSLTNQGPYISFYVISGDQISNKLKSTLMSINTSNQKLYISGGVTTLNIIFGGTGINTISNKDQVSISIDGIQCKINSITSNTITIQYPKLYSIGSKDLSIHIGGFNLNTTINYIQNSFIATKIDVILVGLVFATFIPIFIIYLIQNRSSNKL